MNVERPIPPHERPEVVDAVSARATARRLLLAGEDEALELLLAARDDLGSRRTGLGSAQWLLQQLIAPWLEQPALMQALREWAARRPRSYHARLALGIAWEAAAARIRSGQCADRVSRAQWIGAGMASEQAVACLLQALECNPQGRMAWHRLLRATCYLGEPQWLLAQQAGEAPDACPAAEGHDDATWQAGVAHVAALGGRCSRFPVCRPAWPLGCRTSSRTARSTGCVRHWR
ncbi:DUF4034 domain-containing protein [Stenotrophomonas rhizophila]